LIRSGIQSLFVRLSLEEYEAKMAAEGKKVEGWMKSRYAKKSEQALRCNLVRSTLGESFRGISKRLAECPLFREFCQLDEFEKVRIPGKSMLQEYENWLPLEKMKQVLDALTLALGDEKKAEEIGLEKALEMEIAYIDTTCLEANIHFPADWILMRDAVRGLIKSILTTRRHGLKKKMPEPSSFIKEMNSLYIAMSATGRKPESKKLKKDTLRLMKRLTNVVIPSPQNKWTIRRWKFGVEQGGRVQRYANITPDLTTKLSAKITSQMVLLFWEDGISARRQLELPLDDN